MNAISKSAIAALLLSTACSSLATAQTVGVLGDPDSWKTPEYNAQWGLEAIRAANAYALGVDGTGFMIGVVESGMSFAGHPELAGRYLGGYDYFLDTSASSPDQHAVGVSSVMVANRNGVGVHGVAPGATVYSAGLGNGGPFTMQDLPRAYNDLLARGVRIINNSWGDVISILDVTRQLVLDEERPTIEAYRHAVNAGALIVRATGNDGRDQPAYDAGLPRLFPELERGWLAVAAQGPNYEPWYNNRCGVAMNWCLMAPGGGDWWWDKPYPDDPIIVADMNGGYTGVFGTSFAAPHVSGSAALVWQMFPFFSADQVRQTLLGTARDIGDPGVDEIYGYGLLDVGKAVLGPGRFDWGDFVVEQPGGLATFGNDIAGDGGLVKRGGGELVLTGDSTYAGATRVDGGILSVMGSIASMTSIGAGGVLAGTGVIHGNVVNGGVVWAGDSRGVGTLTVNGDYVQQTDGFLIQQFDPNGGLNQLAVTGTASLAGQVLLAGSLRALPRFLTMPVLTADQGVTGRFDGVAGPYGDGSAPFIQARLRYEPTTAHLDIHTLPFNTPGVCASANQCAVATALERGLAGADADLSNAALTLRSASTRDSARGALANLTGSVHASLGALALGGFDPFGGLITQRISDLHAGQAEPTADSTAMSYAPRASASPAAATLTGLTSSAATPWRDPAASHSAWLRGYGVTGRIGGDANAGSVDYRSGGAIGGVDKRISPSVLVGFSLGLSSTDADFRDFSGTGKIKAYEAAVYGSYVRGPMRVDGILGYARLDMDTGRSISFADITRRAQADYGANRFSGAVEAGYAIDLGWSTLEPVAGLRFTHLQLDGFRETGAGSIGLTSPGQSASSLLGSLGLRLARQFEVGDSRFAIEARGRWQHEFLDDTVMLDTAFTGSPGATFTVQGARMARDSAILGLGLSMRAGQNVTVFAGYDVRLNADATAHAVTAGLRASW